MAMYGTFCTRQFRIFVVVLSSEPKHSYLRHQNWCACRVQLAPFTRRICSISPTCIHSRAIDSCQTVRALNNTRCTCASGTIKPHTRSSVLYDAAHQIICRCRLHVRRRRRNNVCTVHNEDRFFRLCTV